MPSTVRLALALVLTTALGAQAFAQSAQTQAVRANPSPGVPPPATDLVAASTGGPITIAPAGHASVQISHNGLWIDVDPLAARTQMPLREPDVILLTDNHADHMDLAAIRRLRGQNTTVIGPSVVAERVMYTTSLANGESKTVWSAIIEAVPMYNISRGPGTGELFHTKGRGNGYVVTIGGKRIYFAGDTECTPEVKALRNIDVAFLPMNLPYTMTPAEAAACARAFRPAIVYPYHYRGQDPTEFAAALKGSGIEVRLREWYPPARIAPAGVRQ